MKTSLYTILCTIIRFGAVLMAVQILASFPGALRLAVNESWAHGTAGWLVGATLVALLFAFALWLYPGVLARLAASKSAQQVFESPLSGQELQQIAFAVLGIWLVAGGLIELGREAMRASLIAHANDMALGDLRAHEVTQIAGDAIEILCGIFLTLGARGLSGLLYRLRQGAPVAYTDVALPLSQGNSE